MTPTTSCVDSQANRRQLRCCTHANQLHPLRGRHNSQTHPLRPCEHPRIPTPREVNTHPQKRKRTEKANINIATLNINGATLQDSSLLQKWEEINSLLYEHKIAILALQEMHMSQEITKQIRECFSRNIDVIVSEDPTTPTSKAGIAFVLNKALINPQQIMSHELIPGRALCLKIK
jgi:hypothetical protein